ncbi:MAG: hypothetical protein U0P48_09590 [Ancrocorticia sp.]
MYGALKDFLPIVEQLTRLPGKLLARSAALASLVALILGWLVLRSSSGFFSALPFAVGVLGLASALFFGWRRYRLEKAVAEWVEDTVNTFDGEGGTQAVDYSAMYEGQAPSESQEILVIDEDGNESTAGFDGTGARAGTGAGGNFASDNPTSDPFTMFGSLAPDQAQRQHDAKMEATQLRDTWMPRVEAAQRAAIAAAGGTVNAPYLKDDLRVTIVSAILSGLAIPAATFFAFVAFFALL